jgi:uncharacterized protein
MYFKRKIDRYLQKWASGSPEKPILLRGARQIGKSSSIREIGKNFENFIEINFEENPQYKLIFEGALTPSVIVEQITAVFGISIVPGKTLLFFDEIQACVPAISSLRFFYEKMPGLHVIASGSLLEFALAEVPSFGVGYIRSIFMYPFSFQEFLLANNEEKLLNVLQKANPANPLPELLHFSLKNYLKKFLIIGGMPEAVSKYVISNNLLEVQNVLDDLQISIESDFAKYKSHVSSARIREVFNAVVQQIGKKFVYNYPNATLTNPQVKQALDLLIMAGLIYPVVHTSSNGIPLDAEVNPKYIKYLIYDIGIYQRILRLNIGDLLIENDFAIINKGNIAELLVGLELLKNGNPLQTQELFYWLREVKSSNAEVDFVTQQNENIIPIEVKAGTKGAMQSMHLFMKEKDSKKGIRISLENFGTYGAIDVYPLYALGNIVG